MADKNWQQVRKIFDDALRQKPEERARFVGEACGGDSILSQEIESLLSSLGDATSFMESPAIIQVADVIDAETKGLETGKCFGHYEIIDQIGAGGMGEVYLANDKKLDRKVAVKILNEKFGRDESSLQRFVSEAKAASALNHPNILTIYEIGESDQVHYIVSEFIKGKTVRETCRENTLGLSEVVDISIQIANALCTAHEARLVHRDIKPENIMIRPDGFVKVLDFGLAKLVEHENRSVLGLEDSTGVQNQTAKGVILGTVNYMSPEQAKGERVDERTDIFSLGVVIYEMMAARTPFAGASVSETFANLINTEPQPLSRFSSNVPDELQRIISKMLRKNTDERYQTMKDVLTDLRELRENLTLDHKLGRSHTSGNGNETAMLQGTTGGGANLQTAETQNSLSQKINRHKPLAAFALAALVITSTGLGYFFYGKKAALVTDGKRSIAVLPLKPINTAVRDEIYELGIADSVIQKISSARNLVVRQLHAVRNYVELDRDVIEIGEEQNVDFILASSYQIAGGKIKVTSQLLDVATGKVEDTFTVENDSRDLFSAQDAIAGAIGSKLIARFGGEPTDAKPRRGTSNEEAYRLYLQGMYLVEKGTNAETKRSIELFDQAIDLDPNYAAAWAGKGNAHCSFSHMGDKSPADEYEIARPAIQRALELDSNLPEAYATLGVINTDFYWNFEEAEKQFLRAIELNPSSDYAYRWYGNRLVRYGRFDEAVAAMKTAINNNPTNIFHHRIYGWVLYMARRHDEAIEQLERVVEMDPSSPWTYDTIWMAYNAKGDYARAFEWFMKYHRQAGTSSDLITRFNSDYQKTGWNGVLQTQRATLEAKEQKGVFSPRHYRIATLSALVGDKEHALVSLNEAFKYRSANITFLKTDPALDSLRGDPRFDELMRRAGF